MATITLRPTSGSGTSWTNIANAYDGSTTTSATVATTSTNYSTRAGTFNFDTSVIPSGATINSATLTVNCKSNNSTRHTLYADINGSSSSRVISVTLNTTQSDRTADVTNYMSNLSSVKLQARNSRTTSYTFTLYEIYITVDYTQNSSGGEEDTSVKNIKIGASTIDKLYLGTSQILKAYLGSILLYSYSSGGTGGGTEENSPVTLVFSQGKNMDDDGNIIDDDDDGCCATVELIPVIGGSTYEITINPTAIIGINEYNSEGNGISTTLLYYDGNGIQQSVTDTYTTPTDCAYIRIYSYSESLPTGTMSIKE